MEIKTIKINKNDYDFICRSGNTYNGFYHKVKMLKNGYCLSINKVNYLNRTWEQYTFQTAINGAVNIAYNNALNEYINAYKETNGIIRLKHDIKERLIKEYNNTTDGKQFLKLKKIINGNGHELKSQYINIDF